jgi:predicted outer membrane protein
LVFPSPAHIAYTAGQVDIKAAKQALGKSQNKDVPRNRREAILENGLAG